MFYFVTCSLIWGLTWIAIGYQFHSVDSSVAVFYRFAVASLILFLFVGIKKIPLKFPKEIHFIFLAQGFFMFCLNYQITYFASHLAPSALLALGGTAMVYFNLLGGKIFLKTPIQKQVLIGASVGFLGMALISMNELSGKELHPTSFVGFLLGLLATASASAGNLISSVSLKRKIPIAPNNAWSMLYGSVFTLIYCLATQRSFVVSHIDYQFALSYFYLTVFGSILSFGAYLKLIDIMGPSKAAFTSIISPVIAIMASMLLENLALTWLIIAGTFFCLAGNVIALNPKNLIKGEVRAD